MPAAREWGIALLRIVLGAIFVMHGGNALVVLGPQRAARLVEHIGYAAGFATVLAWYLIVVHLVGGILLVLGLGTRWAALAQLPIMISAVYLVHVPQGFFMKGLMSGTGPVAGGYEFALLVLVVTIAIALTGPGALAFRRER